MKDEKRFEELVEGMKELETKVYVTNMIFLSPKVKKLINSLGWKQIEKDKEGESEEED